MGSGVSWWIFPMIPNRMRKWTLQEQGPPCRKTCINMSIISRDEEGIVTLSSVLVPTRQKRCGQAGEGPESGQGDDPSTGKLPCEEKLRELSLLRSWEKKAEGDVLSLCSYKEIMTPFLQGVTWKRWEVMGTSYSWGYSYCTQFFAMTMISHQNNLLREVVDSHFKIQLDMMLDPLVQIVLLPRKVGPDGPSGPF